MIHDSLMLLSLAAHFAMYVLFEVDKMKFGIKLQLQRIVPQFRNWCTVTMYCSLYIFCKYMPTCSLYIALLL